MALMDENSFISKAASPITHHSCWEAPSNIALIKYWGKVDPQLPKNPSLSFTLSTSLTKTEVEFHPTTSKKFDFSFFFAGESKPEFKPKLEQFFNRIASYTPWLFDYELKIKSENSFPHSSGIASSASAMAALSLNLMDLERQLFPDMTASFFHQKASFLARLGSGSAARSVQGPITIWGKNKSLNQSSDLYALPFGADINPVFKTYQDCILLVDKGVKTVTSSQGHELMYKHPFAEQRFLQATRNLSALMLIMKTGDLDAFIKIVELEALTLHAMMMTSNPYFILMKANTLAIIEKIWAFRDSEKIPVCFTLDAGANVHILYPEEFKSKVNRFIKEELASFCQNGHYLKDQVGEGAKKV